MSTRDAVSTRDARRWLAAAKSGYCAKTSDNKGNRMRYTPRCDVDRKGVLEVSKHAWSDWLSATAACITSCLACKGCNFISLSLYHQDCSWYSTCPPGLPQDIRGFRSGAVRNATRPVRSFFGPVRQLVPGRGGGLQTRFRCDISSSQNTHGEWATT